MSSAVAARRLLLPTGELEAMRQQVVDAPLPTGFALAPVDGAQPPEVVVHPAVADDLRVLARPEVAVTVRARRPGLEVTACVALSGPRGAGLLRTGDTAVQLSCFPATALAAELARVVPAPLSAERPPVQQLPLDVLLAGGRGTRLAGSRGGLHAIVVTGGRSDAEAGPVGSVEWVWDGRGWIGLEPLPTREGRPWVRLVPVEPVDLAAWVAPLLARAIG